MTKRNNGFVTETAHLNTNMKKYGDNYDKIFGKKSKELPLEIDSFYINLKNGQTYQIFGFVTDCDTEKEKVLYTNDKGEMFSRLPERFRQKFKLREEKED
jgi:hypothetical protein